MNYGSVAGKERRKWLITNGGWGEEWGFLGFFISVRVDAATLTEIETKIYDDDDDGDDDDIVNIS